MPAPAKNKDYTIDKIFNQRSLSSKYNLSEEEAKLRVTLHPARDFLSGRNTLLKGEHLSNASTKTATTRK